jgi:hypothetical protein
MRSDGFFLVYRKDCPPSVHKRFETLASKKFVRCAARKARNPVAGNPDTGWPDGPNILAGSAFIEMSILLREKLCRSDGFLLFEPDCIPLEHDWIDQLSAEWERVKALGKEAFGHWHQSEHPDWVHMNGNAVFRTNFFDKHPNLIIGPATVGWDFFFKEQLIAISVNSNLIHQNWNRYGLTEEEFLEIRKNGVRPALFHGVKTPDARAHARKFLLARDQPVHALSPESSVQSAVIPSVVPP